MNRLWSIIVTVAFTFFGQAYAQSYEADILRFSSNNYSGTARFIGVGGAFTSVGADMSNFSFNPAGVGMYRSSVAQFSFGVNHVNASSVYLRETNEDFKLNATIPSLGMVFASKKTSNNGLFRGTSIGFAFNRLADYNSSEKIDGFNTTPRSSLSWVWANEMSEVYNGQFTDMTSVDQVSFNTYSGFYGYLANFDSSVLDYTTPVLDSVQQTRYIDSRGGKNEMALAVGTNYLDKLYLGATLGIPLLNYQSESCFIERDGASTDINTFFNEFELKQDYRTEGLGFNFKMGVIYRAAPWLRLGGSFQTPERISLTERYSSELNSEMDFGDYDISSGEGIFQYRIRLPWQANLGLSFFFKNKGFLSMDYGAVGYNSMRYTFENDFREISDAINAGLGAKYKLGHQLRIGIEGLIKQFRLRAGYNYSDSPLKEEFRVDGFAYTRHTISGGFGMLFDRVAIDFAYQYNVNKQFEQPYVLSTVEVSGVERSQIQGLGVLSLSYKLR